MQSRIKALWEQIIFPYGCLLFIVMGVFLRARHFFENRSLWVDEAITAVGITSLSFKEIFLHHEIYPNFARSPVIFRLMSKSMVSLFGAHEYVLRFFPFILGLLAIFFFYRLLKRTFSPFAIFAGLVLFCVNSDLIYYSAELKHYSADVVMALALVLAWETLRGRGYPIKGIWGLGVLACLGAWLSYTVIFVMGAIGIVSAVEVVRDKETKKMFTLGSVGGFFLLSVYLLYVFVLSKMAGNEVVVETWKGLRQGMPFLSWSTILWIKDVWIDVFSHPLLVGNNFIVHSLWFLGFVQLMRKDRIRAGVYFGPILLTLLAALGGKYPFHKRLILFLVPFYYFFMAQGLAFLFDRKKIFFKYFSVLILLVILIYPFQKTWLSSRQGYGPQQNREIFDFINEHYIPGEAIFLNTSAQYPFIHYIRQNGLLKKMPGQFMDLGEIYGTLYCSPLTQIAIGIKEFEGVPYISFRTIFVGFDERGLFKLWFISHSDPERHYLFKGDPYPITDAQRAWVVFISYDKEVHRIFLDSLNLSGKKIKGLELEGVSAHLYQFP